MTVIRRFCFAVLMLIGSTGAFAVDFAIITNMAILKWQLDSNNRIWLRNLNTFDARFLACCYDFYVDASTPLGQVMWATMLSKIKQAQPLTIGVNAANIPGPVVLIGDH